MTFHSFVTETYPTCHTFPRSVVDMTKTTTPWGPATRVEQLQISQRVGEKSFSTMVELLERADGEQLVRIAYSTGGAARRGPVTLRLRDLERLRGAVARSKHLAHVLGQGGGA